MKLIDGGSDSGRLNVVLIAEGYTARDRPLFEKHGQQFASQVEREGWYRKGLLNLHALYVESKERAPTVADGKPRDTAFGSYYGGNRAKHVISGDDEAARRAVFEGFPDTVSKLGDIAVSRHIAVLVNSTLYGGKGGGAGGGICWTYTDARNPQRWTGCALHELGHSLFGLADEYGSAVGSLARDYAGSREPDEPNVTLDGRGAKWRHLVEGAVAGAKGYDSGIYRPTRNCRMRTMTEPFCPVCEDAARRVLESYLAEELPEERTTSGELTGAISLEGKIAVIAWGEKTRFFPDNLAGIMAANRWLLERKFG